LILLDKTNGIDYALGIANRQNILYFAL